jgi:hypothetical protein
MARIAWIQLPAQNLGMRFEVSSITGGDNCLEAAHKTNVFKHITQNECGKWGVGNIPQHISTLLQRIRQAENRREIEGLIMRLATIMISEISSMVASRLSTCEIAREAIMDKLGA